MMARSCGKVLGHGECCIPARQCGSCEELDQRDAADKERDQFTPVHHEIDEIAGHIRELEKWVFKQGSVCPESTKLIKKLKTQLRAFESTSHALGWVLTHPTEVKDA